LKLAPFDRSYASSYQSAIVHVYIYIALSCTIFEIFDDKEYRDLCVAEILSDAQIIRTVSGLHSLPHSELLKKR